MLLNQVVIFYFLLILSFLLCNSEYELLQRKVILSVTIRTKACLVPTSPLPVPVRASFSMMTVWYMAVSTS